MPSLTIEPAQGERDAYKLTSGSTVGALEIGGLSVLIRPKISIPQLLSLACYAMGDFKSRERRWFDFQEQPALPDTLALALAAAARRAFARGLLHGYLAHEEALPTVRGRIRFDDQLRHRFGLPLPVEVRYDEFTDDILANRLVKAAVARLGGMRLRSPKARRDLGRVAGLLDNVSLVAFPPNNLPQVSFDRLNQHYRDVVGLSRLILRHSAFQSSRGTARAAGFLIDMNTLFPGVRGSGAEGRAERVSERVLRSEQDLPRRITLDTQGRLRVSSLICPGGTVKSAHSWATRSTRTLAASVHPAPTSTSCWPTPPHLTCRAGYWSTPRARRPARNTRFAMLTSCWSSRRWTWTGLWMRCWRPSGAWPSACTLYATRPAT